MPRCGAFHPRVRFKPRMGGVARRLRGIGNRRVRPRRLRAMRYRIVPIALSLAASCGILAGAGPAGAAGPAGSDPSGACPPISADATSAADEAAAQAADDPASEPADDTADEPADADELDS